MCRCRLISASICGKCHLAKEHITQKQTLHAHTQSLLPASYSRKGSLLLYTAWWPSWKGSVKRWLSSSAGSVQERAELVRLTRRGALADAGLLREVAEGQQHGEWRGCEAEPGIKCTFSPSCSLFPCGWGCTTLSLHLLPAWLVKSTAKMQTPFYALGLSCFCYGCKSSG